MTTKSAELLTLRDLRLHAGLTQQELADRIGIAQSVVSRLESGKQRMTVDLLAQVAQALHCDPGTLLRATRRSA